jgi:hypothetical protein
MEYSVTQTLTSLLLLDLPASIHSDHRKPSISLGLRGNALASRLFIWPREIRDLSRRNKAGEKTAI